MKKNKVLLLSVCISASMGITALAGQWTQDASGWYYQNDDGSHPTNNGSRTLMERGIT